MSDISNASSLIQKFADEYIEKLYYFCLKKRATMLKPMIWFRTLR